MKLQQLILAGLICGCACAQAEEYELIPEGTKLPYVFAAEANAFAGKPDSRSVSFKVNGAEKFGNVEQLGNNGALKLRVRATQPFTEAVEVVLKQSDGKAWGSTGLPIDTEWQDVILPFKLMKYFDHWGNMPAIEKGELLNEDKVVSIGFCFGRWLCPGKLDKPHGFEVESVKLVRMPEGAFGDGKDHSIDEFPRLDGEADDTARFQRAVNATPGGVLSVPRGEYEISSMIKVHNRCSLELNKNAILKAVKPMKFVIEINARAGSSRPHDYSVFFKGGVVDGNGLASCVNVKAFAHYTIKDCTLLNGKDYGLRVDGGYEVIANNVYCKCTMNGLAGNSGVYINGGDSHYTDCIVVDYTIGFNMKRGGSNRLTRCHVWGGPVPPLKPGELPEMLKDSICFKIDGDAAILRDCYADTGKIGYEVNGWDTRLLGCSYFNNKHFGLDHITIIKHTRGRLLVEDGGFVKMTPNYKVYDGIGTVEWRNMMYAGFGPNDDCPGALSFKKASAKDQSALKLAE